jgi:hypothetical protein
MRRFAIFTAIVLLALTGIISSSPAPLAHAQEATPCPLWPPRASDITSWEVGQFMQWPSTILVEFQPGASQPFDDGTTGAKLITLYYIQSGVFTLESPRPMAIYRADANGEPQIMTPNKEITVAAGDYFLSGPGTPAIRNESQAPASY